MKRWFPTLGILVLVVGAGVVWLSVSCEIRASYRPGAEVQSLGQFLRAHGNGAVLFADANENIFVRRKVPEWHFWITIPSSRPEYVFDKEGRLIDWHPDPGDSSKFQSRWPLSSRHRVSEDDALRVTRRDTVAR
jgi:hypothetical protein